MPKRCLQHCARYGASLLDPDAPVVDGGEMLTVNLMHCAMSCWWNDADNLPQAQSFDLPCRRYTEWPADDSQNWLQNGKVCDLVGKRACLDGRCTDSTGVVLGAINHFFSGAAEEYYFSYASRRYYTLKAVERGYGYLVTLGIAHAQLRPPGPLVRPDWKKVQRQDYEREQAKKANEQAEAGK